MTIRELIDQLTVLAETKAEYLPVHVMVKGGCEPVTSVAFDTIGPDHDEEAWTAILMLNGETTA